VWRSRFGHVDHRGGGRTSGRETLSRVIGGAVADAWLRRDAPHLRVVAWVAQVGAVVAPDGSMPTREEVDRNPVRCPHPETAMAMASRIEQAREQSDSLGGAIDLRVVGVPLGLGEPVFGKLKAELAGAMAGIGAVTGVTWGPPDVRRALERSGREFHQGAAPYGGIQGGLANGEPVEVRIFFKPPASLGEVARTGRHDPCILPRAVPVVEAMASLVLADLLLQLRAREHRP
jgi:chorismate synthase